MQHAIIIPMDSDTNKKENLYAASIDDMKSMKRQMDEMTRIMGSMDEAIRGNDRGTEGFVKQIQELRKDHLLMNARIEIMEQNLFKIQLDMKARLRIWSLVWALVGVIGGTLFKSFIDKISKK